VQTGKNSLMAHRGLCWAQHDMTTGSKQRFLSRWNLDKIKLEKNVRKIKCLCRIKTTYFCYNNWI
jgi:hypothetical protein